MTARAFTAIALCACMAAHAALAMADDCPVVRLSGPEGFALTFGNSLAINDRHLLIGDNALSICPGGDPFECTAGAVHAFEYLDGQWTRIQTIVPPDIEFNDGFGRGLALDQRNPNRFIALSNRYDGVRVGIGHVYEFDGEQWNEVARFYPPDTAPLSSFGFRSALHNDTLLVNQSNLIHRYRDVSGEWQYQDTIGKPDVIVGTSGSPGFGRAGIALDDDWAFVGAPRDGSYGDLHGAVAVYRRQPDGSLDFAQHLLPPVDSSGTVPDEEFFGVDVGFDGHTLVVGASYADRDVDYQGVAYVYEFDGERWAFRQELRSSRPGTFPGHYDHFGGGISIEGDTLIVGYSYYSNPLRRSHLFRRGVDGLWREVAVLEAGDAAPTPAWGFGYRSAMNGRWAVFGASQEGTTGASYVFDLSCILADCPPDLDLDGTLTIFDFLAFANLFQDGDAQADFDGDGELTLFDFLAFQTAFDAGC